MEIRGKIVDLDSREIYGGVIEIEEGYIVGKHRDDSIEEGGYILPGFVDAHVHIESSMLTPENFGRMVARCGTIATVSDPHEIANVMGVEGVEFMLESAERSAVKHFFTIPSCVPATPFDSAGGEISVEDVERMAGSGRFVALSEMMNVVGVLSGDDSVVAKLSAAREAQLPIDGHAPLLRGDDLAAYIAQGVVTDHEVFNIDEAREKIALGMKIIIREGGAARNLEALMPLLAESPEMLMFGTDDAHPDYIVEQGDIDGMVRRAIASGYDLFDVLRVATRNAVEHYSLAVGELRVGDRADFIVVEDLKDFKLRELYVDGEKWCDEPRESAAEVALTRFNHAPIDLSSLRYPLTRYVPVIELIEDEIITREGRYCVDEPIDNFERDIESDLVKIVYINRYNDGVPQIALCRGFGLKSGAFASSVAHDSHNIIAVGTSDRDLLLAINSLIESRGGLVVVGGDGGSVDQLPLPIGGIMSNLPYEVVTKECSHLNRQLHSMGVRINDPFLTLAFLSLVVVPEIKIGERGLFSFSKFDWI